MAAYRSKGRQGFAVGEHFGHRRLANELPQTRRYELVVDAGGHLGAVRLQDDRDFVANGERNPSKDALTVC